MSKKDNVLKAQKAAAPKQVNLPLDPTWAYDGWKGTGPPFSDMASFIATAAHDVYTASDALTGDIGLLPAGEDAYMSYVDNFGGWGELVARFGKTKAYLVSITIFGGRAHCADVEPGAMVPSDLGGSHDWIAKVALKPNGEPPWVYTSAANWGPVNEFIGGRDVIRWSAHFGQGPHICGPHTCGFNVGGKTGSAEWTQWDDHGSGGQNIDRSIGMYLPASVKKNPHYERFDSQKRALYGGKSEREVVEQYDKYRALQTAKEHPHRAQLDVLRAKCHAGVVRLTVLGHANKYSRAWRKGQLQRRAKGHRVV